MLFKYSLFFIEKNFGIYKNFIFLILEVYDIINRF